MNARKLYGSGVNSAALPGEVKVMEEIWLKFGSLPWSRLVSPSITMARNGFPVPSELANKLESNAQKILSRPAFRRIFAPNGTVLAENETLIWTNLADSLETIASEGASALYGGKLGQLLMQDVMSEGGNWTMEDLTSYTVKVIHKNERSNSLLGISYYKYRVPRLQDHWRRSNRCISTPFTDNEYDGTVITDILYNFHCSAFKKQLQGSCFLNAEQ